MKTIGQIKTEIDNICFNRKKLNKREENKVKELRQMIRYLETNPEEAFITNEVKRLEREIKIINGRYKEWCDNNYAIVCAVKNPKRYYESENDIPKRRYQLKSLMYILAE